MFSTEIKSVHFTGIGGTGMAAAAAAMQEKGFAVTGSDQNVYPPMSTFLAGEKNRGDERLRRKKSRA
jgi:UDP-N-acetylmuramate-alanine ligase